MVKVDFMEELKINLTFKWALCAILMLLCFKSSFFSDMVHRRLVVPIHSDFSDLPEDPLVGPAFVVCAKRLYWY